MKAWENFNEWADRWGIPTEARQELDAMQLHLTGNPHGDSEAVIQSQVRLEAARAGIHLWRNNIGAGKLESGNFVRFGLGNDSAQVNAVMKSADLIGVRPRLITHDMVGSTVGQFVSREIKRAGWSYTGSDERARAQLVWAKLVNSQGGDARIVDGLGSFK